MFKDFLETTIWRDISSELKTWLEDIRDQLESLETDDSKKFYRLQGNSEAVRNMLRLPEQVLNNILDDARREERSVSNE